MLIPALDTPAPAPVARNGGAAPGANPMPCSTGDTIPSMGLAAGRELTPGLTFVTGAVLALPMAT